MTRIRSAAAIAVLALAVAGCGGDGETKKPDVEEAYAQYHSAPAIMADGFETMLALETVHLRAEIQAAGDTTRMDLTLRRDGDCLGTLQIPGWTEPADFVVVGGRDYVRGSARFWSAAPEGDAAERYAGRWVTTGDLASYCDFDSRLAPFTRAIDEQMTSKDGLGEVGGAEVVRVSTPTRGGRLRAWVEVAEPHHVRRLELTGGRATGALELSGFDDDVRVEAPPSGDVVEFTG